MQTEQSNKHLRYTSDTVWQFSSSILWQSTLQSPKHSFHAIFHILNFLKWIIPNLTGHSIWFIFWDVWMVTVIFIRFMYEPKMWFWNLKGKKSCFLPLMLHVPTADKDRNFLNNSYLENERKEDTQKQLIYGIYGI